MRETGQDGGDRERPAVFGRQRFGKPQHDQRGHQKRKQADDDEDHVPFGKDHDQLADAGCDHRDDHEDHQHQRHDFGHHPAAIDVADDGNRDDAGGGGPDALNEAQCQKPGKRRNEDNGERAERIEAKAAKKRQLAAEAVRQWAEDELRTAHPEQIGGNDILAGVFIGDAKACADLLKTRQHDVDRNRVDRHQHGHQGNELWFGQSRQARRFGWCGHGIFLAMVPGA